MNTLSGRLEKNAIPANILCVDQYASLGGGQRSLLDMLPAFSERGWRPSVAIAGDGPFPDLLRSLSYSTYSFACGSYAIKRKPATQLLRYAFELPSLVNFLGKLVEVTKADLLYVNGPRLAPPAAWVAWRRGIPLVFHCHNRLLQQSAIALTGQALELASAHVIACCQYAADPLTEYVRPERLRIIYNGVADMAPGGLQVRDKITRIGVVGRVEEEKGQLQFVEAAKSISRQAPECRFTVIGTPLFSGFDYYRKVVASSRGLPIDFLNWQDNIANVYKDLDLLVVPSTASEATTRVILEAYSAGIPVVAFPVGGIPEILEDGQTGFLAAAVTAEALAKRILLILRLNRARVEAVVEEARQQWAHRFTLQTYRDSVCSVLAQAMQPQFQNSCGELRNRAEVLTD